MAEYQMASDAFDGSARSGVIRADGRWIACGAEAASPDWDTYVAWRNTPGNVTDRYRSPADGGVAIILQPGEEAVGSMLDSMPPDPAPGGAAAPAAAPPPMPPPAPNHHSTTGSGSRSR